MSRTACFRKALLSAALFIILPCVLPAQEHAGEEARSAGPAPSVFVLHVESESFLRVDFQGRKNWGASKKDRFWRAASRCHCNADEHIAAPADSTICVTVSSVEKIREHSGFWRKTGRAMVRAFNPLETSRPAEFRVELSTADLLLPTGEVLRLQARVCAPVPVQ